MIKTLILLTTLIFSSLTFASSGAVGSASNIKIRGVTSISNISDDETINAGATEYIIIFADGSIRAIGNTSQCSQCTKDNVQKTGIDKSMNLNLRKF